MVGKCTRQTVDQRMAVIIIYRAVQTRSFMPMILKLLPTDIHLEKNMSWLN